MDASRQAPSSNSPWEGADGTSPEARIEAALGALRGRGRRGPGGFGGPFGPGGPGAPDGAGGPFGPGDGGAPFGAPGPRRSRRHDRGERHDHREHEHGEHEHHAHDRDSDREHGRHRGHPGHERFAAAARIRLLEALAAEDGAEDAAAQGSPTDTASDTASDTAPGAARSAALSIVELAARIGVDQPRASRLVQQAAAAGTVRRSADPADGRRSVIQLTEAGRAAIAEQRQQRRGAMTRALADFTREEAETFAGLLERFARGWAAGHSQGDQPNR